MSNQGRRVAIPGGTMHILTGESYGPRQYTDPDRRVIEGFPNRHELLHRAEGDVWIREQADIEDIDGVYTGIPEFLRVDDNEAQRILIALNQVDALVKYGLVEMYSTDKDEGVEVDELSLQMSEEGIAKLSQIRTSLVELSRRMDNDPEQQNILDDCIKELSAIENLAGVKNLDAWWSTAIQKALNKVLSLVSRAGEQALIDEILKLRNFFPF